MVNSPAVLSEADAATATTLEHALLARCLKHALPAPVLDKLALTSGRPALVKQLKQSLLQAIGETHSGLGQRLEACLLDVGRQLDRLPVPTSATDKRRTLDVQLKQLEAGLADLIGASSRGLMSCCVPTKSGGGGGGAGPCAPASVMPGLFSSTTTTSTASLRMQLMVHAPEQFKTELASVDLQGDVVADVKRIVEQAALEQGGSFDSDAKFYELSQKIIDGYAIPCRAFRDRCTRLVQEALAATTHMAFGEYKQLESLVLAHLGVETRTTDDKFSMLMPMPMPMPMATEAAIWTGVWHVCRRRRCYHHTSHAIFGSAN